MSDPTRPLVLVSNRGPVTFQEDGSVKRGTGGLVTALTGLASHRDAVWIASALTDGDVEKAREEDDKPFAVRSPAGGEYQVRLVASDPEAYDRFYNIFANPMLWFIQHYLWDLSNAPDVRRNEIEAFEYGYNVVNEDLAHAVIEEIDGQDEPVVMVHDYHLYTLPGLIRPARVQRLRPVPRAAPRVPREGHVHRAADAVADRRAGVRRVPRAHRGARRGRQPPPRHARLDADQPEAARRPRGGGGVVQALRRAARQRDVRRDEPRRQGGSDGQRARRRLDPVG